MSEKLTVEILKCKACGAPLDITQAVGGVVQCDRCFNKNTIGKSTDKEAIDLLLLGEIAIESGNF